MGCPGCESTLYAPPVQRLITELGKLPGVRVSMGQPGGLGRGGLQSPIVAVIGGPDYESLARTGGTLVLFMGMGRLDALARGLIAAGLPATTPSAVVSRGTLPDQATVDAPLADLPQRAAGLPGPALVVVGDVVGVRGRILPAQALGEHLHLAVHPGAGH